MELPNMKSEYGKKLWHSEVKKFAEKLEELTGQKITAENLKKASKIVNEKRKALRRLSALRKADPCPVSGLDALLVNQVAFYDDPLRFTQKVNELCDELEERVKSGTGVTEKGRKRVLVSGSPMAIPNWKLHYIIENSGGVVVGEESCVGERNFKTLLNEDFSNMDEAFTSITDRYLTINCACFTPNNERMDDIKDMVKDLNAGGVIHYSLQFCTPYMIEAQKVKKTLDEAGVPFLKIETDYSMEDAGQLKTRVEAFMEMI
jgi:benzoyl-CoA reductase/2-hydroxyglutaryl-CoA dehydratase subunit BcrC/BadD/HgdB